MTPGSRSWLWCEAGVSPRWLARRKNIQLRSSRHLWSFFKASTYKMCERSGTFYRMSSSGGAVYKEGDLPCGTSGGPWILAGSNNASNDVQAGNNTLPPKCSVSPYFR